MTHVHNAKSFSAPAADKSALEEGSEFTPRFDEKGLITAVVTDAQTQAVLMVAHMNAEALKATLDTGEAHFWSRSRGKLWKKGETSGNTLKVASLRADCDQDALWLSVLVTGEGAACHTGRRSCFYRKVVVAEDGRLKLVLSADDSSFG